MISIIIPVYNVEKYLRVCLDSVINQSYSDYEVILVDDGSTDSSPAICDEYCKNDSRFQVIHQENMGLASARNTGIRAAKGDYMYFIDSDDCIHPDLFRITVSAAEATNANLVQVDLASVPEDFTNFDTQSLPEDFTELNKENFENDFTQLNEQNLLENLKEDSNQGKCLPKYYAYYDTIQSLYNLDKDDKSRGKDIRLTTTVVWTKLYRRSTFQDFLFPEGMRMHEDQMVAHRNIVRAGGMVYINLPLYFYRQSNQSLIRKGWSPKRLTILDCYDDRLRCCMELRDGNSAGNTVSTKNPEDTENSATANATTTTEATNLTNYIFKRYLVCLFRNYCVVANSMNKKESSPYRKMILTKTKSILKEKPAQLSSKDTFVFKSFTIAPSLFAWAFKLRGK